MGIVESARYGLEAPAAFGDGLGEIDFEGSYGGEAFADASQCAARAVCSAAVRMWIRPVSPCRSWVERWSWCDLSTALHISARIWPTNNRPQATSLT
jgi:hypothetical protein